MIKSKALKRLYQDYTSNFIGKIFLAAIYSVVVAISTYATAWLLAPAIEKLFLNKDKTLIFIISFFFIVFFMNVKSFYFMILIIQSLQLLLFKIKKLNVDNTKDCLSKFKSNNFLGFVIFVNILIGKLI